jgi:MFS transporter, DHA3 family, macrolide efflux protein
MNPAAAPAPQLSMTQVLKMPAFRKLWLSQLVSIFGDFLALYAVYSLISFKLHGSPRQVTLVTVFFLLPLSIIGPIAGVFVDRWNAKRTMVTSDAIRGFLILGLLLASAPWHIYMVFFVVSTFSSFFMPAQSVTLPQIVPMEGLMSANASMQNAMQLVRIVSPALSGVLVGWLGERSCYYIDSASFFVSAILISQIAVPERPPHANARMNSVFKDLFSGMRFILTHPVISFVILSIAAGMFAIGAFGSLTAVYVRDVLHGSPYLFGTLGSMVGGGMLVGGFVVTKFSRKIENKASLISLGMLVCGAFIALVASTSNDYLALLGCFGLGLGASLLIIPSMALMQGQVPAEMRGRVSSSSMSLMTIAQGIALIFAGDLASRYSIVAVYYGSAVLLGFIGLFGFLRLRKIQ